VATNTDCPDAERNMNQWKVREVVPAPTGGFTITVAGAQEVPIFTGLAPNLHFSHWRITEQEGPWSLAYGRSKRGKANTESIANTINHMSSGSCR
jgi:hypothetical protein